MKSNTYQVLAHSADLVTWTLILEIIILVFYSPRFFDDLRPYALVQFVPCIAIPIMAILLPPMYTHSTYWLWAAGLDLCYGIIPP